MSRQFRRQIQKQKAPAGAGMGNMGMPNMSSQMGNIMKMQEMQYQVQEKKNMQK